MAWRLLGIGRHSIFENMATDEAVFQETVKNEKCPALRFYLSSPVAVSIGYFQDAKKEINLEGCRADNIDVVRRMTGGKAVFHDREITYSLAASSREKKFPDNILETYKIISRCIARGLGFLGIRAELSRRSIDREKAKNESCCFSVPAQHELLVGGRKICGSAQFRKRGGFLQHGLLFRELDGRDWVRYLIPPDAVESGTGVEKSVTAIHRELAMPPDEQQLCFFLKKGFEEELGVQIQEDGLSPAEEMLRNELLQKYTDDDWNIERKKYF